MSKIITLTDPITGAAVYPMTSTEAVIDPAGSTIGSILEKQNENIEDFSEEVDHRIQDINVIATDAVNEATSAKNAVSSLSGLNNANTAAETLAGLVSQIEDNSVKIAIKPEAIDTDYVIADIEETLVTSALRKTEQILSTAEKAQVIENIGAVSYSEFSGAIGNINAKKKYLSLSEYTALVNAGKIDETVEYNVYED